MSNELAPTNEMGLTISQAQHQILTQATPADEVRYRRGKGGRQFPYTDPAYVIRTLNLAFGWDWDFEADKEEIYYANDKPFEAKVRGRLTVRNGDKIMVKMQFGCQPIEYLKDSDTPVSLGDAFKGAASDALKKCASLLGIALDLYDSDSDVNTGKVTPQATTVVVEPPKATNGKRTFATPREGYLAKINDLLAECKTLGYKPELEPNFLKIALDSELIDFGTELKRKINEIKATGVMTDAKAA